MAHRLKELFPEHQEIDAKNFVIEKAAKFGLDLIGENFDARNPGVATLICVLNVDPTSKATIVWLLKNMQFKKN